MPMDDIHGPCSERVSNSFPYVCIMFDTHFTKWHIVRLFAVRCYNAFCVCSAYAADNVHVFPSNYSKRNVCMCICNLQFSYIFCILLDMHVNNVWCCVLHLVIYWWHVVCIVSVMFCVCVCDFACVCMCRCTCLNSSWYSCITVYMWLVCERHVSVQLDAIWRPPPSPLGV